MKIKRIYICFIDGRGFVNYDPIEATIKFTQTISEASESSFQDWEFLIDSEKLTGSTILKKENS
jgi:hypothetical protein